MVTFLHNADEDIDDDSDNHSHLPVVQSPLLQHLGQPVEPPQGLGHVVCLRVVVYLQLRLAVHQRRSRPGHVGQTVVLKILVSRVKSKVLHLAVS